MRWNEIICESHETMFHVTSQDRVEAILAQGLKTNSSANANGWYSGDDYKGLYGCQPIFLLTSLDKLSSFSCGNSGVVLEVSTAGLKLLPDFPHVMTYLWDRSDDVWDNISSITSKEQYVLNVEDENGKRKLTYAVIVANVDHYIDMIGTAACVSDIPPNHIKLR